MGYSIISSVSGSNSAIQTIPFLSTATPLGRESGYCELPVCVVQYFTSVLLEISYLSNELAVCSVIQRVFPSGLRAISLGVDRLVVTISEGESGLVIVSAYV